MEDDTNKSDVNDNHVSSGVGSINNSVDEQPERRQSWLSWPFFGSKTNVAEGTEGEEPSATNEGFTDSSGQLLSTPQKAEKPPLSPPFSTGSQSGKRLNIRSSLSSLSRKNSVKVQYMPLGVETNWISAIQVSVWLNISGPKVEVVWQGAENINEEIENYIARRTLCGEVSQVESIDSPIEIKFYVLSEIGYLVIAALFSAPYGNQMTKHSFSVLVRKEFLHRYLIVHSIVEDRIYHLVAKLRALLIHNLPNPYKTLTEQLEPMLLPLEHLYNSGITSVRFPNTALWQLPPGIDVDFLARAVTSHLQTHGCTVVIGDDAELVNTFVDTLALFLSSNEKLRSSYLAENRPFVPNLCLQGTSSPVLSHEVVMQSLWPTTVVDLSSMIVKQTYQYHEYTVLRKECLLMEIENMFHSKRKDNLYDDLFRPFTKVAPFVYNMLTEALRLPLHLRESYVTNCNRLLIRKAVLLIRYVEAELNESQASNLEDRIVRKIRSDMELNNDADFSVLLGISEKLAPGIYVALAGDPATIAEKVIEIFE